MPGAGNPEAKVIVLGEAPGAEEVEQGVPFVGRAGRFLRRALEGAGLRLEELYFTNVVKCRPPENRLDRYPEAVVRCAPFITEEIRQIRAPVVLCLGRLAGARMGFGMPPAWGRVRLLERGRVALLTWHPSYVLRRGGERAPEYDAWMRQLKTVGEFR